MTGCCAHRKVTYRTEESKPGTVIKEWWACMECEAVFVPAERLKLLKSFHANVCDAHEERSKTQYQTIATLTAERDLLKRQLLAAGQAYSNSADMHGCVHYVYVGDAKLTAEHDGAVRECAELRNTVKTLTKFIKPVNYIACSNGHGRFCIALVTTPRWRWDGPSAVDSGEEK